jgi:hypothetical protein
VDAGEAGEGNLEILVSALDTNIPTRLGLAHVISQPSWVWIFRMYISVPRRSGLAFIDDLEALSL